MTARRWHSYRATTALGQGLRPSTRIRRRGRLRTNTGNSDPDSMDDLYLKEDYFDEKGGWHDINKRGLASRAVYERAMRDQYLPENMPPAEELAAWRSATGQTTNSRREQNPLGASFLAHGGVLGTTGILVALGVLLYGCGRMLARHRASGSLAIVNGVLAAVVVVRVVVVVAAALSLAGAVR